MTPSSRRRTTTERRVFEAAAILLRGGTRFSDLTVESIIELADVSRASFYKYFTSKGVLVQRIAVPSLAESTQESANFWLTEPATSWKGLAETIGRMLRIGRANAELWQAYFDATAAHPDIEDALHRAMEGHVEVISQRVATLRQAGSISTDMDPIHLARFMIRGTYDALVEHLQHGSADDDDAFTRTLGRALWFGAFAH
ncbi:TetR/AcrR family transcriptional regulator [Nocardia sp. NPDC057272]|uniref:TetR/AcrR family transcriptional regulator n=1 Tax=Nocardia sp. NPDC057272 TaxID=3346079 RepID=UPI0036324181